MQNGSGSMPDSELFISVLTLGELHKGVAKLPAGERCRKLEKWIEQELAEWFEGRVVPLDEPTMRLWGQITGEAERKGRKWPVMDSLLAASALAHQLVLVTRNQHHVEGLGVKNVDPWGGGQGKS